MPEFDARETAPDIDDLAAEMSRLRTRFAQQRCKPRYLRYLTGNNQRVTERQLFGVRYAGSFDIGVQGINISMGELRKLGSEIAVDPWA